ncbi:MAG: MaoC family dehydratase [Acidimicrobiales bacterium]|nr:MaoC family dehydratase [Acidimicrobiales bacterium]
MKIFRSPSELLEAVGDHLGYSNWILVDQERIDLFAEATGDKQWIHVDPQKASEGPFGKTIAHGYLTLSLTNRLLPEIFQVDGISMGINYGTDRVRFPTPLTVGSTIRVGAELVDALEVEVGVQTVVRATVEIEDMEKPACVVDSLSRFIW